jgi:hypothetical protein
VTVGSIPVTSGQLYLPGGTRFMWSIHATIWRTLGASLTLTAMIGRSPGRALTISTLCAPIGTLSPVAA